MTAEKEVTVFIEGRDVFTREIKIKDKFTYYGHIIADFHKVNDYIETLEEKHPGLVWSYFCWKE